MLRLNKTFNSFNVIGDQCMGTSSLEVDFLLRPNTPFFSKLGHALQLLVAQYWCFF